MTTGTLQVGTPPITNYAMGLPFNVDGGLVLQVNQPVSPGDAYVGGVRVGPLGGVYAVDTTPPVGVPPVNTVAPDTTGDAKVGSVLTTTQGTWTGTAPITYTYQWYSGINTIVGATTNTYTVQASDLGNAVICRGHCYERPRWCKRDWSRYPHRHGTLQLSYQRRRSGRRIHQCGKCQRTQSGSHQRGR